MSTFCSQRLAILIRLGVVPYSEFSLLRTLSGARVLRVSCDHLSKNRPHVITMSEFALFDSNLRVFVAQRYPLPWEMPFVFFIPC